MSKISIYKRLVNEHKGAKSIFKDAYSFKTKHNNILFEIESRLKKELSKQIAEQKIIDDLTNKMVKRKILIDSINYEFDIAKSITEEDLTN